jgi:hypothetical protein
MPCESSAQKILSIEIDKDPIELSGQIFTFEEELFKTRGGQKKLGKAGFMAYRTGPLERIIQVRGPLSPKPRARACFFLLFKGQTSSLFFSLEIRRLRVTR